VRTLTTPRWIARHVLALCLVASFLALGWWQLGRAADGNVLSFGYAVEWPVFASFVAVIWVREARRALRGGGNTAAGHETTGGGAGRRGALDLTADPSPASGAAVPVVGRLIENNPAYDDHDDEPLADYNAYLRWLNANPGARPSEYPARGARPNAG